MAKQTIIHKKTTISIKARAPSGDMMKCNMCGGTGYQKKPKRKKK